MAIFKNTSRVLLGVLLMTPSLILAYNQFTGKDSMFNETISIPVLINNVDKNTIITSEMFTFSPVDAEYLSNIEGIVTDPNVIIGSESKNFILANSPLCEDYFGESLSILHDDEMVFSLPSEWLLTYPQTLRRYDTVYLYAVSGNRNGSEEVLPLIKEPILTTTIYFVKDSNNREVLDAGSGERLDGTSNVSNLELKVKKDDILKLTDYANRGYKFIVAYE